MDHKSNLVQRAQNGDQNAITELYNQNYHAVLGAIRSLVKDEDEAMDLLQDTFVKAFGHLDQLKGDFGPWVKRIGINTAKDFLKKKKPILFSQMQGEEDGNDTPIEESFAQETFEGRPDIIMDEQETARLLGEILDSLLEEQRIVINLCYYQEMSYKEIASTLGIPENLVRSRLNLGREKVEKQVLALEKKGTKLYGLAPITFLLFLFRNLDAKAAEMHPDQTILYRILSKSNSFLKDGKVDGRGDSTLQSSENNSTIGQVVSEVVQKINLASQLTKAIIAGVIVLFGISMAIIFSRRNVADQNSNIAESSSNETIYDDLSETYESESINDEENINDYNMAMYQYKQLLEEYIAAIDATPSPFKQVDVNDLNVFLPEPYFALIDFTEAEDGIPQLLLYGDPDAPSFVIYDYYDWTHFIGFGTRFTEYNPDTKQFWGSVNKIYKCEDGQIVFDFIYLTDSTASGTTVTKANWEGTDEVPISYDEYKAHKESFSTENVFNAGEWIPLTQENVDSVFGGYELTETEKEYLETHEAPDLITW